MWSTSSTGVDTTEISSSAKMFQSRSQNSSRPIRFIVYSPSSASSANVALNEQTTTPSTGATGRLAIPFT